VNSDDNFSRGSAEVLDSHALFEAIGRGVAPYDENMFLRTMAPEFRMVTPEGAILERGAILAHLAGLAELGDPDFEIRIDAIKESWRSPNGVVLTYVEAQVRHGKRSCRRSTALFIPDEAAPNRVVWRHLHETWMRMAGDQPGLTSNDNEERGR